MSDRPATGRIRRSLFPLLKKLTRNDIAFLAHRALLRTVYGNRLQRLANRDMFHRPEWFWGPRSLPKCRLVQPASSQGLPPEAKKLLIQDLITSFNRARELDADNRNYSELWAAMIDRSAGDIVTALAHSHREKVGELLEGMFSHPALWGIGYGDFGLAQGDRFAGFVVMHQVVGLAECLGVARTECPEQGEIGYALERGLASLVEGIENQLQLRMDFPRIGGAYGILAGERLIDLQTPGHIYAAHRLKKRLAEYATVVDCSILEIGAGFGGAAFWFLQQAKPRHYAILDLALTNVYQGWFLANALGRDQVTLFADVLNGCLPGDRLVSVLPVGAEPHLGGQRFTAMFNQDSFPEMPEASLDHYLRLARDRVDGILFSYNQEAFSPFEGKAPPWVCQRAAQVGGLSRISRELSWVRRGYVEEVYRPTQRIGRGEPDTA